MQVIVDKHTVTIVKNEIVNEGEYNVQSCNFQFSSDYDGLPKIAIFKTGTVTKQIMLSGNTCITPEEVLQTTGIVGLGVYAYQTDGDNLILRYSPTPAVFTVEPGSYDEGDAPTPPTPSVIEQLQEEITQNANNITSLENVTSTHTTQIGTLQTDVNNIKTEQITQNTNIQTNANDISNIKAEQITQNNNIQANADDITTLQTSLSNETTNRENADINLQQQIDAITSSSDIVDIVGTYAQLMAYDTQHLSNNDVIKVLQDETHGNAMTYYRWDKHNSQWIYIGQEAPYYTKSETDTLLQGKANANDVYTKDQIDDTLEDYALKTDITDFITEQEVDTKLEDYVETTTYTQGQATQDANIQNNTDSIEDIESLIEQMPTVSGQGTDISLQNVLNYRLMKFLPQGVSSQESTTGKNLLPITNQDFTINDVRFQAINGELKVSGTASADITGFIMRDNNYFPIMLDAGTYYLSRNLTNTTIGLLKQTGGTPLVSLASTSSTKSVSFTLTETTQLYFFFYIPNGTTKNDTFEIMVSTNDGDWESYTGGIPAPNPSYSFPVKSVTGENSLVISNSDNTETQTYPISLGNIELCSTPDGTIRDYIYGTPDNWYKREYIGKVVLDGSESWEDRPSYQYADRFVLGTVMRDLTQNDMLINYFKYGNASSNIYPYLAKSGGQCVINFSEFGSTTLEQFKEWLATHNTIVYGTRVTPTDIPITDTTLINQLNNIYNNAHSYNGETNITTTYASGNEQMYLDVEALAKGGSTTTETDPTVPSYVKGITQQNITDWNDKQDELVSGTNIKTINNESLLGSGNITIQGGGSSYTAGTNIDITNENVINNTIPFEGTSGNGFVVGQKKTNTTINTSAIGVGKNITASGLQTVVIGNNAVGSNQMNVAIGEYAKANNSYGIAIGRGAEANGESSTVIGYGAVTYQSSSIALGRDANARQSNLFQIGSSSYPINKAQITTSTGDKELATTDFLTTVSGYDATKTQILKNVNGTMTWVDE